MNLKLMINIKDIDKDGNVFDENEFEANSLVKGFIGILAYQSMLGSTNVLDTSGVSRIPGSTFGVFAQNAAAGNALFGIVVGSDNTAVDIDDYALGTLIAHGTGAGQLEYSAMSIPTDFTVSGSDAYFEVRRTVTNNSGGDVTINEIGLYVKTNASTIYYFCIDRTLSTTTVTNTNGKVITYKFQVTI